MAAGTAATAAIFRMRIRTRVGVTAATVAAAGGLARPDLALVSLGEKRQQSNHRKRPVRPDGDRERGHQGQRPNRGSQLVRRVLQ